MPQTFLTASRGLNESWRQCVERMAGRYGMERECLDHYDTSVKHGDPEDMAAYWALYEWDCLDAETEAGPTEPAPDPTMPS